MASDTVDTLARPQSQQRDPLARAERAEKLALELQAAQARI